MKKAEQLKIIKNIIGLSIKRIKRIDFNYNLYTKNSIIEFKKGKEKYLCIYNGFSILCIPRKEILLSDIEIQGLKNKIQNNEEITKDFIFTKNVIKYYTKDRTKGLKVDVDIDELKETLNSNAIEKNYSINYILDIQGKSKNKNKKMFLDAQMLFDLINISNAKNFTLSEYLLSLDGYCQLFFYSDDKKVFGVLVAKKQKSKK